MRPWTCIPAALLALLPLVASTQLPFETTPRPQSVTLLDALYADPDYESLVKLLQTAKLIPTFNKLNGSTFFAPTNEAISRISASNPIWRAALDNHMNLRDNIQAKLRQQLFYHLLNYTLPQLPAEQAPQVHDTLLYPRRPLSPPSREPPPNPPWMPVPGGTLGGAPQRLRLSFRDNNTWVGVDAFGDGGAQAVKEYVNTTNGNLLGIGEVLEMPPDLATVVSRQPSLSYLSNIITPDILTFLNDTSELTLFLPVDAAWEALPQYEKRYLQSEFATEDLIRIMNLHAVVQDHVIYSESFRQPSKLKTIEGQELKVVTSSEDNKTRIISDEITADLIEPDIYASNGVLHTVSSFLIPPGALQFTPEKYLLGLNCTSFVSMLHSVNLTHLINDTEARYTILAPQDDVISSAGNDDLPERGSDELKRILQYHFLPGRWTQKKLRDGILLETALEEPGLDGGRQVLAVEASDKAKKDDKERTFRFGGAGVLGYKEINNTLIYFISRPLVPPTDALQTALPSLELSSFLAAIFSADLAEILKATPRTTLLMPHNNAFKRLGMLVSTHLLAASSKPDLEKVIKHHALVGVEYAGTLQDGSQHQFPTLEGSDVHVDRRTTNGSILISASGGWAHMQSELYPRDMLTQTGVIHELSDIMIPHSVDLTVGKLVRAAKGTTMATMLAKAGLDFILNGTQPPENSSWADMGISGTGWTLLCPTDDAFKQINLTELYADEEQLRAIVTQHLIPPQAPSKTPADFTADGTLDPLDVLNNNSPLSMEDAATYTTLHTRAAVYGDVVFRELGDEKGTVVGVKGARGAQGRRDWARVLSWGRATKGGGIGGVVQIDRLLVPYEPQWWIEYGPPLAVGGIGVVLICLFFLGVRAVWRRDTTEATYEPVGGFGHEDSEES